MKIALLLSGGVDSSVVLRLLKDHGHDITAFYLKIWLQDEFSFLGECPWEEDIEFARKVCGQSGVPLEILSLQNEYWDSVVTYTIDEIKEGRTPNPDIYCNSLIKFGSFYEKINSSFEKVASGHYAVVEENQNRFLLKTSPDLVKDQTYFLANLNQQQLSRAMFPLGPYNKKEVRRLAEQYSLPNMSRKDSQGICFLGQIKFNDFVKHHLGELRGDIIDLDTNRVIGPHNGYYFYTIGQRSGLGLSGGPWYVVKKDVVNNIIFVSREDLSAKARNSFSVGKLNWISKYNNTDLSELHVKIRHGSQKFKCSLEMNNDTVGKVTIDRSDRGVAAGQFAVFYVGNECLGGGVILQD